MRTQIPSLLFLATLVACGSSPLPSADGGRPDGSEEDGALADAAPDALPDAATAPCASDDPTLSTTTGCIVGRATEHGEEFLGIPYAEPPVGELRWRPPVPVEPWG